MIRAALLGVMLLAACESPAPDAPAEPPDGRVLYAGTGLCYACHGDGGMGTPRGPNLTDAEWLHFQARPTADSLAALIARGVAHPLAYAVVMPAARLDSADVWAVALHVLALSDAE